MATSMGGAMDQVRAKQLVVDAYYGKDESLLAHVKHLLEDEEFLAFLRRFQPIYIRKARLQTTPKGSPSDPKGERIRLHLPPMPGEAQLRAAYEIAIEGFLDHLEGKGYPVLVRGEGWVEVYQPQARDLSARLKEEWQDYLNKAFGFEGLSRSLLPLLNSVKLAPQGFSIAKVPVASPGVRDFLATWYLASLLTVKERLVKRQAKIQQLEIEVQTLKDEPKILPEGQTRANLEKVKNDQEKELQKYNKQLKSIDVDVMRLLDYDVMRLLDYLDPQNPSSQDAVRRLSPYLPRFGKQARQQLNTSRGDIFSKISKELLRLLDLKEAEFQVPLLVSLSPRPLPLRPPGDTAPVCYGCGRPLGKDRYKVSKLVFSSPSQRPQSGRGQTEPEVCSVCAAISLLSPLKPGEGSILVRIGDYGSKDSARYFAQRVVTGTLHVAAGRYVQFNSPTVGGKPLAKALGRLVYAVYVLSKEVNPVILRRFPMYLLEGSQTIPLPKRALWLAHVLQEVYGRDVLENGKVNRDVAEALQHAVADRPWHALYVLARRFGEKNPFALHKGLETYAVFLEEGDMERARNGRSLAERFRDVAGFIGLLYAWADFVDSKVQGDVQKKRALGKLLDNLDKPSNFLYAAGYEVDWDVARLYEQRSPFFYEQAKRLLEESGARTMEQDDGKGKYLEVPHGAIWQVYAYLAERYSDWDAFMYEVRLGLAARFPKYIRMTKEEQDGEKGE